MNRRVVILNELAQGIRPLAAGVGWFEELTDTEQFEVVRDLAGFCIQARATSEDGPESIRRAGIRPTHTPAVLVTRGRLTEQLPKSSTSRRTNGSRPSGCWSHFLALLMIGGGGASVLTGAGMPGTT